MVTDIHCHFIPDALFKFVQSNAEFATRLTAHEGERIDINVRGMHFGLNPTFFEPSRQIARIWGSSPEMIDALNVSASAEKDCLWDVRVFLPDTLTPPGKVH